MPQLSITEKVKWPLCYIFKYSETSLIGPPMGPMISDPITENLINAAINKMALLLRFSTNQQLPIVPIVAVTAM